MLEFMMKPQSWGYVIAALIGGIAVFLGMYASTRVVAPRVLPKATTSPIVVTRQVSSTEPASSNEPASSFVTIKTPESGSHVNHAFTILGTAPQEWFSDSQFPIMVRDQNDNVVGRATGRVVGSTTDENAKSFTASMRIDATYHGPATLILLKSNPSGMPENDDAMEVPIVVD